LNIPKAVYYAVMDECLARAAKMAAANMIENVEGVACTLFENRLLSIEDAIRATKKRKMKEEDWQKILETY